MDEQILEVEVQNQENTNTVKIANDVVATIAGIAASEIEGVAGMSGNMVSGLSQMLGKKQLTKGVKVEITDNDVALDISIIIEYGRKIPEVAGNIQLAVSTAVGDMTGLNVDNQQAAFAVYGKFPLGNDDDPLGLGQLFIILAVFLVFGLGDKHMGQGIAALQFQQAFKIVGLVPADAQALYQA